MKEAPFTIIGQGLAGSCLAWWLYWRGYTFEIVDANDGKSSSLVAAGLVNPISGANFSKSWEIERFLPEALDFFRKVELELELTLWHPMEIVRVFANDKIRQKAMQKWRSGELAPFVENEISLDAHDWLFTDGLQLSQGGRVDTKLFIEKSRAFFKARGMYRSENCDLDRFTNNVVFARGARGLMEGDFPQVQHRSAKGEILTLRIPDLNESRIIIESGWLIPLGDDIYRAGANYEWTRLDWQPTQEGRDFVEKWLKNHLKHDYEVLDHQAGIRPIVRTSIPLIQQTGSRKWVMNGLGSKGYVYAPSLAESMAKHIVDSVVLPEEFAMDQWKRS